MKIVEITPCYRITLEHGSYGVETYIDADSKIQITFDNGNILTGNIERVEYGTYPNENDTLIIRAENGELYFIEKVAFQEPYRLVKLKNRTELSDYLMEKYDVAWEQDTTRPFIMENDNLLEGYRQNPLAQPTE